LRTKDGVAKDLLRSHAGKTGYQIGRHQSANMSSIFPPVAGQTLSLKVPLKAPF
jgi:hypothetical protein